MKILVIQQKMIGDVLVSALLAEHIKKHLNHKVEVHYMIHTNTKDVVLHNTFIDKIHLFDLKQRKNYKYKFAFLQSIRKEKFDVVIDVYSKIETAIIARLSGAPKRISHFKKYTKFLYTDVVTKSEKLNSNVGLTIEERIDLLAPLGIKPDYTVTPKIFITDSEKQNIDVLLNQHQLDRTRKTFMVSIIGSSNNKTYPLNYMAEVVDYIAETTDCNLLFNYIPNQIEEAKKVFKACKKTTQEKIYFDLLGRNLREFIVLMDFCDAIIGNDGGAINMAKALNKPSFIIFSPWINKESWNTYEDNTFHKTIHLKDYRKTLLKEYTKKELKENCKTLYLDLKPSLFSNELRNFISELEQKDLKKYKLEDSVIVYES